MHIDGLKSSPLICKYICNEIALYIYAENSNELFDKKQYMFSNKIYYLSNDGTSVGFPLCWPLNCTYEPYESVYIKWMF